MHFKGRGCAPLKPNILDTFPLILSTSEAEWRIWTFRWAMFQMLHHRRHYQLFYLDVSTCPLLHTPASLKCIARQRSWAKAMFSRTSVILSTRGYLWSHVLFGRGLSLIPGPLWGWVYPRHGSSGGYVRGFDTPSQTWDIMGFGWQAGGTHLTGMFSCSYHFSM